LDSHNLPWRRGLACAGGREAFGVWGCLGSHSASSWSSAGFRRKNEELLGGKDGVRVDSGNGGPWGSWGEIPPAPREGRLKIPGGSGL